jgi:hypothetical protein
MRGRDSALWRETDGGRPSLTSTITNHNRVALFSVSDDMSTGERAIKQGGRSANSRALAQQSFETKKQGVPMY